MTDIVDSVSPASRLDAKVPAPRVLVITYHAPPDGAIGGRRWAGMSKYLTEAGWEVDVVTAAPQHGAERSRGYAVHVVNAGRTLNDHYNSVVRRIRRPRSGGAAGSAATEGAKGGRSSLLGRIRHELSAWLAFPDYGRGWITRAALRARRIVRAHRPDVVITSGPPHSVHLVGFLATRGTGVPHVVDMRDPWVACATNEQKEWLTSSMLRRLTLPRLERHVLRHAAGITTTPPELAEALGGQQGRPPVACVPNAFDETDAPSAPGPRFPGLSLAYVGTLYFGRDLGPVLSAFSAFLQRNPSAAEAGSKLRVAGHVGGEHLARFRSQLARSGLEAHVELMGVVERSTALELLARSTVAVVLAQDQKYQIPAKLYESVGMGIPTVVVTEPDSASAREARRIGAVPISPEDPESLCRFLEDLWSGRCPDRREPLVPVDYRSVAEQMGALLLRLSGRA